MGYNENDLRDLLKLYDDWGVDAFIGDKPVNRFLQQNLNSRMIDKKSVIKSPAKQGSLENKLSTPEIESQNAEQKHEARIVDNVANNSSAQYKITQMLNIKDTIKKAFELADSAQNLSELKQVIENFDGCLLKKTASNTVFADGNEKSDILLLGEAPGADEDRIGKPFVGRSGKLLDAMFNVVGLTREKNLYITNVIPWRPPGNRTPSAQEVAICLPFLLRHLQLIAPKIIILVGATALGSLLRMTPLLSQYRGSWYSFDLISAIANVGNFHTANNIDHNNNFYQFKKGRFVNDLPDFEAIKRFSEDVNDDKYQDIIKAFQNIESKGHIAVFTTYHPSYLLRSPGQKKKVWPDMQEIKLIASLLGLYGV